MRRAAVTLLLAITVGCGRSAAIAGGDEAAAHVDAGPADASEAADRDATTDGGAHSDLSIDAGRLDAGDLDAEPRRPTFVAGKALGAACSPGDPRSACASGLVCCVTGFRGHCGGAYMPETNQPPCVLTSTCIRPPCSPISMPP